MSAELATVFLYGLKANDLEAQITYNLEAVSIAQKYASNEVAQINLEAACEEELVQNHIDALEMDDEYADMVNERFEPDRYESIVEEYKDLTEEQIEEKKDDLKEKIREIREEADEKREEVETRLSDFETEKQMENDSLEAQLQHCSENKEAYKELAIQNAQDNASYFQ